MPMNRPGRSRDQRGAVAVMTALMAFALLITAALTVDLGNTWARRGQLQVQADRAATYAAQFLPADDAAERTTVAKAVAYYLACHPVSGQRQLDPTIPSCPSVAQSSTLDNYAAGLLTRNQVTIPVRNQVRVVTPEARIDFGFARVAGFEGTNQQKTATAKVTSPGSIAPIALSLDCLLNPLANAVTTGGIPFGYISTTHKGEISPETPPVWVGATATSPTNVGVDPSTVPQQVLPGTPPTVRVTASGWPDPAPATATIVFAKGDQRFSATGPLVMDGGRNRKRIGSVTVTLPAGVVGLEGAGQWEVKIQVGAGLTASTDYLDVEADLATVGDVACGRLAKSPRGGTQANHNFVLNLQEGLDHLLTTYPGIVATPPVTRDALWNLAQLTQCGSAGVKDTNGVSGTPNCVVTNMSGAYARGFTEGMIGAAGRLTCTSARPCARSFPLVGRSINDDRFSDFVRNPSLLSANTFFNLDTFLSTGMPVVTPTSNLDRNIYNSHRFLWVAVISTAGATAAVQAGDYPILTFRPIFIVQDTALSAENLPLLAAASLVAPATIPSAMAYLDFLARAPLGTGWSDEQGLLMDETELQAVRFMTISPEALPAVPAEYTGPESEYLGVGPRIIRLVE